jgi:hypothetical protein
VYLLHVTLPCGLIQIGTQTLQDAIAFPAFSQLIQPAKNLSIGATKPVSGAAAQNV